MDTLLKASSVLRINSCAKNRPNATANPLRIGLPHWFSFNEHEKYVTASVEPSGLQFYGQMNDDEWENWKKQLKEIATKN